MVESFVCMNSAPANLFVAVEDDIAYLRVVGRANFVTGAEFKSVVDGLMARGTVRFAIDLKDCVIMDSTFIGLLTGYGMQLPPGGCQGLSLHNATDRVAGLLSNLGVRHLFIQCPDRNGLPRHLDTQPATGDQPSHLEMQRICLEAHHKLMQANPENVERFKDVTRFLEEDLRRGQGA